MVTMSDGDSCVFRQVAGLWISPEVGVVAPWRARLRPCVDYDAVDYAGLGRFLEKHFYCGETVSLRLPDDALDHVAVLAPLLGAQPSRAHEFAQGLLRTSATDGSPIPVRHVWDGLQRRKDRRRAPPPVLLLFLITGAFEAVTIWHAQASMRLGIRAADLSVLLSGDMQPGDHDGRLTDELHAELERQFGVPYQRHCRLAKMASTPPPAWSTGTAAG